MDSINVKELRKKLKKTQSQLAVDMGVTTRTIQKWEAGDTIPPAMENLLRTFVESISNRRTEFALNKKDNNDLNEEMIRVIIDELDSQRETSRKFQEQIDKLLIIIEKLSNK